MRGTVTELLRRWDRAKDVRRHHEHIWQAITRFLYPNGGDFTSINSPGHQRNQEVYDSTPQHALRDSTAVIEGLFAPRNTIWQGLQSIDPSLRSRHDVQEYVQHVQRVLFAWRNNPAADFYGMKGRGNYSTAGYGNECFFEEELPNGLIRYESIPIKNVWCEWDVLGRLGRIFVLYEYTAEQAKQRWPSGAGKKVADAIQGGRHNQVFPFLHVVGPRSGYDPFSPLALEMPWESLWISVEDKDLLDEGGNREMPYQYARATLVPGEQYGRGIGDLVLPDTKSLYQMERDETGAREIALMPPTLTTADGPFGYGQQRIAMRPRAILYGGIDEKGRKLIDTLNINPRFDGIADSKEQKRDAIKKSFLTDMFQIFMDRTMTATEVTVRLNEKGALLAPLAGSQYAELYGPMTQHELGIHGRAGRLPEMPAALAEAQGQLELIYENEATRLMRQQELVSMQQSLAFAAQVRDVTGDETVMEIPDTHAWVRHAFEVNGVSANRTRSPEDVAERIRERAEESDAEVAAETFPGLARGVRDLTEAGLVPGAQAA